MVEGLPSTFKVMVLILSAQKNLKKEEMNKEKKGQFSNKSNHEARYD